MNKTICATVLVALACASSACSKKDLSPGDTVKTFLTAFATEDLDGASAVASPAMKARMLADPAVTRSALKERRMLVEKCGGYKDITSSYDAKPDQTSVEGFSLIQYNGPCPPEKQWVRVKKNEGQWLVDEFGPSTKP